MQEDTEDVDGVKIAEHQQGMGLIDVIDVIRKR